MKDTNINEELAQLRWACRRGMLELDLLLRPFLEACFLTLSPAEQGLFRALLNCLDQDLFAWFMEAREPSTPQFLPLIKKIQDYARTATATKTV